MQDTSDVRKSAVGFVVRLDKGCVEQSTHKGWGCAVLAHRRGSDPQGKQDEYDLGACAVYEHAAILGGLAYARKVALTPATQELISKAIEYVIEQSAEHREVKCLMGLDTKKLMALHSAAKTDFIDVVDALVRPAEQRALIGMTGVMDMCFVNHVGDFEVGEQHATVVGLLGSDKVVLAIKPSVQDSGVHGLVSVPINVARARFLAGESTCPYSEKVNIGAFQNWLVLAKVMTWSSTLVDTEEMYVGEMEALLFAVDPDVWPGPMPAGASVAARLIRFESELAGYAEYFNFDYFNPPDIRVRLGGTIQARALGMTIKPMLNGCPVCPRRAARAATETAPDQGQLPLCHALWMAQDGRDRTWQQFIELYVELLQDVDRNSSKFATYTSLASRLVTYQKIEAYLAKREVTVDQLEMVMTPASQSANQMIAQMTEWSEMHEISREEDSGSTSRNASVTVTTRVPLDLTGSEHDVDARSHLLAAAQNLRDSDIGELRKLAKLHDEGKIAELVKAARTAPPLLQRLLLTGEELEKALANQVPQETFSHLRDCRASMNRHIDKQFTEGSEEPEEGVKQNNRAVRVGVMRNVRLLRYVGKEDEGTVASPLVSFAQYPRAEALQLFGSAVRKMQRAWLYVQPNDAADVMTFCDALHEFVEKRINEGVSWVDMGAWYRAVIAKVDQVSNEYARSTRADRMRGKPLAEWVTSITTTYAKTLSERRQEVVATQAADKAATDLRSRIDAIHQGMSEASAASASAAKTAQEAKRSAADAAKAAKEKPGISKKDKQALKAEALRDAAAKRKGGDPPVDTVDKKPRPGDTPGTWDGRSRAKQEAHLLETLGMHEGKKPCLFFHTPGRTCTKGAACGFWHEK